MSGANWELMKDTGSKLRHARVTFFKRLAVGAADPQFAAKLQALIDEYEAGATTVVTTSGDIQYASNPELAG